MTNAIAQWERGTALCAGGQTASARQVRAMQTTRTWRSPMGGRDVPFDEDATCDNCGAKGAYDFMGDFLCLKCFKQDG